MESVNIAELDASFNEVDFMPSLFSLFRVSVLSLFSDNSRPQLAHSIKLCKLWAWLGLCFCLYDRQV